MLQSDMFCCKLYFYDSLNMADTGLQDESHFKEDVRKFKQLPRMNTVWGFCRYSLDSHKTDFPLRLLSLVETLIQVLLNKRRRFGNKSPFSRDPVRLNIEIPRCPFDPPPFDH